MARQDRESELVTDAARGDRAAFSELYRLHRGRVYNFAHRMVGVRSIAEEVTHEAFLVLIEHPGRYRPERGSLLTFLCAVARHHIMHHLRRGAAKSELSEDALGYAGRQAQPGRDPLGHLLDQELAAAVDRAIAALTPLQREVIVLREFQELTYEEIAQVTGAEVSVIKVRLHRARQTLKRQLAMYLTPNADRCHELH